MKIRTFIILALATGLTACSNGGFKNLGDWNKRDRGAAIGGSGGAVLGAAVGSQSGNTGVGALLGGAAGAGASALIGNEIDKNDRN